MEMTTALFVIALIAPPAVVAAGVLAVLWSHRVREERDAAPAAHTAVQH